MTAKIDTMLWERGATDGFRDGAGGVPFRGRDDAHPDWLAGYRRGYDDGRRKAEATLARERSPEHPVTLAEPWWNEGVTITIDRPDDGDPLVEAA